ncbi:AbrB/MazE/SpoVT family DNA-binding domain-containing protein [Lactobacillus kitasatonis]|uniref:Uncharacterized protein n=1 Tax=Lactobacillus kitasatonis DSM 16761 = JCM 1039 TaxID=1423767 RepID=A0A0R1VIY0_9LACO|nr:hypothetical protein [Lactobacillus kitasatonis]KRM05479.1 hypothetical protein FC59_GL000177 [Lactobacillus kitasatonis DSM 16761 = JCM 1039]
MFYIAVSELPTKFEIIVNEQNEIILKKQKEPKDLKELFKGFDYKKYWADWKKQNSDKSKEEDWGEPVGREVF